MRNIVGLKDPRTGKFKWVGFSKFEPDDTFVRNRQLWPSSSNGIALTDWLYDLGLDGEYPEPVLLDRVPSDEVAEARAEWIVRVEQKQGCLLSGAKHVENLRRTRTKTHPPRRVPLMIVENGRSPRRVVESGRKAARRQHALLGRSTG